MNHKIKLILPYFGEFPNYFNLFLKSCKYNETIDWLLITNIDCNNLPENVHIVKMNFIELQKLISNKLEKNIKLEKPYKLCDYKPAYGIIFEDYLKGYDFWGHCDMDMIFEDIRKFVTKDLLNSYNKLFVNGHLTLYKNEKKVNKYFLLSSPFEKSFLELINIPETMYFDEIGIVNILNHHKIKQFRNECFLDILPQFYDFRTPSIPNNKNQFFYWEKGKIFRKWKENNDEKIEEYLYIHLQKRRFPDFEFNVLNCRKFYITPKGFRDCEVDLEKNLTSVYMHSLRYYYKWIRGITLRKVIRTFSKKL